MTDFSNIDYREPLRYDVPRPNVRLYDIYYFPNSVTVTGPGAFSGNGVETINWGDAVSASGGTVVGNSFAAVVVETVPLEEGLAVVGGAEGSATEYYAYVFETTALTESVAAVGGTLVGADSDPPDLSVFSPVPGTTLLPGSTITFSVTDATALRRSLLIAQFPSGAWDVIHDGDTFAPKYSGCSRTPISGGYQFVVVPNSGWLEAPTLRVIAIDTSGNELA